MLFGRKKRELLLWRVSRKKNKENENYDKGVY